MFLVGLHLGAELQLGQQRPQDSDLPPTVKHNDQLLVELHESPHLELGEVQLKPVHLLGVGHPVLLVEDGVVVVSPLHVLLVHGLHLSAELQLGQRLSQDLEPPHHAEHVHELPKYPHHESPRSTP